MTSALTALNFPVKTTSNTTKYCNQIEYYYTMRYTLHSFTYSTFFFHFRSIADKSNEKKTFGIMTKMFQLMRRSFFYVRTNMLSGIVAVLLLCYWSTNQSSTNNNWMETKTTEKKNSFNDEDEQKLNTYLTESQYFNVGNFQSIICFTRNIDTVCTASKL